MRNSLLLALLLFCPAAHAGLPITYTCDLKEGMFWAATNTRPVGYITTLQIGTTVLKSDTNGKDPVTKANLVVIGVLKRIAWSGNGGDQKQFVFNISRSNKQLLDNLLRDPRLSTKDVRISYLVYDYDSVRTRYWNVARPKSAALQARFVVSGGRVELGVSAEQESLVPQPVSFESFMGLLPARAEQAVLHTTSWGQTPAPRPWTHNGP